ncbi:3-carboxymuconate cyclase [Grosmannia clavigera kw1407]|uniref:3-carboxymuconate cyclase n=1 Tax=Grosmannia clavigera (strain kw1407 / UAMH 11150) TaxID=655863 RepID=F0XB61_GROCL|nr:3-carboxymuconate cyclase [Grosmannia clavigera kw1407]EFX04847.1 3-carboxymuconate cyclase [Grosmannia clavigera kw1407]
MRYAPALPLLLAPLVLQVLARPAAKGIGAVYLITNEKDNAVLAMPIQRDGLLSAGKFVSTGGSGANGIDGSTNKSAAPDALFSQSSLTVSGQNLFAVNAGSNTVSMFAIDARDPTKLKMVGKPAAVPGEFPSTVASSAKHNLVCVGTTGAKAGVSCATFSAKGLGTMDALRPFKLGQSTPPVGPTNTVSQVFFSDDGATLFSTVKGDPTKNNTGFLAAFSVTAGKNSSAAAVSKQGKMTSPPGTAVLFGSSTIPGSKSLFVTDASFGAAVLSVSKAGSVSMAGKGVVAGQKATCWAAVSNATKTAFVTDVATNRLVEMSLTNAKVISEINLKNGDPGLIDLKAAGNFIYALSPGNGTIPAAVTVVSALNKTQVQHFRLRHQVGKNAQGMAVMLS